MLRQAQHDNRGEYGWTGPHRNRKCGNGNGIGLEKKSFQTFQTFQSALTGFHRMCQNPSMRQVSCDSRAIASTAGNGKAVTSPDHGIAGKSPQSKGGNSKLGRKLSL
jgi:hypothetical protein